MSRKSVSKVSFFPEMSDPKPTQTPKHQQVAGNRKRVAGIWPKRSPESQFSPGKLWRSVARALGFVSIGSCRRRSSSMSGSKKVDPSTDLMRSRSVADPINESHRAEAIGDCIKFLNSSSSPVQRSKSDRGSS